MRRTLFRAITPLVATTLIAAWGGGGAEKADTAAAAAVDSSVAAAAAPAPESFTLKGAGPDWTTEIAPAGIVFDGPKKGAKPDTLQFEYKAPSVNGAIREFTVIRMQADTHRIDITLAMTKCKVGTEEMDWKATVWVDQKAYNGCGNKK